MMRISFLTLRLYCLMLSIFFSLTHSREIMKTFNIVAASLKKYIDQKKKNSQEDPPLVSHVEFPADQSLKKSALLKEYYNLSMLETIRLF